MVHLENRLRSRQVSRACTLQAFRQGYRHRSLQQYHRCNRVGNLRNSLAINRRDSRRVNLLHNLQGNPVHSRQAFLQKCRSVCRPDSRRRIHQDSHQHDLMSLHHNLQMFLRDSRQDNHRCSLAISRRDSLRFNPQQGLQYSLVRSRLVPLQGDRPLSRQANRVTSR